MTLLPADWLSHTAPAGLMPVASRGAERHADGEVGLVGVLFGVCFHFGAVRDGVERHDLFQLENTAGKQGGLMLVAASEQFNFVGCAVEAVVDVAGNPLVVIDEVRLVHARCSEGERSVVELPCAPCGVLGGASVAV